MAKCDAELTGDINKIAAKLHDGIMNGSLSVTFEDESTFTAGDVTCMVRVYERYSWIGGNRLTCTLMLAAKGDNIKITAITSGGSQAMFFKINTYGEEAFLEKIVKLIEAL